MQSRPYYYQYHDYSSEKMHFILTNEISIYLIRDVQLAIVDLIRISVIYSATCLKKSIGFILRCNNQSNQTFLKVTF